MLIILFNLKVLSELSVNGSLHSHQIQLEPHFEHHSRLTWVVLREAGQGLCRVHTNIIFGKNDLAIQA